jgi:uroporphyrinogen-III synthase
LRLAISRTEKQLTSLSIRAKEQGVEIIPLPLITIENIPFDLPADVNLEKVDWLLFSSANGVEAFFARLSELGLKKDYHTRIGAVGAKTAEAVCKFGYTVDFIPSEAYGTLFFPEFIEGPYEKGQTVLYARGREVNFDPLPLFMDRQASYVPIVCYEGTVNRLEPSTVESLTGDDYILFTAPSSVRAHQQLFGAPKARIIAIGRTTATEIENFGWPVSNIMATASVDNILEYI